MLEILIEFAKNCRWYKQRKENEAIKIVYLPFSVSRLRRTEQRVLALNLLMVILRSDC